MGTKVLQKYSIFGGLSEEQIEKILPIMKHEKFNSNMLIITEGKPNDKLYFIIEGQVAVTKKDIVLSRFGEGEAFGEMEFLDITPSAASIKSISDVTLMSISNQAMRELYKLDVTIFALMIMNLARDLSRRLRKMDEKFTSSSSPQLLV